MNKAVKMRRGEKEIKEKPQVQLYCWQGQELLWFHWCTVRRKTSNWQQRRLQVLHIRRFVWFVHLMMKFLIMTPHTQVGLY